jgi:glycosyltransferase involved in cell wall biosynthesis
MPLGAQFFVMNILYINHYAGGPAWGMEYRPYYLAREWVKSGHQVTVVAASTSHVRTKQPTMSGDFTQEEIDGIHYIWCDTPAYQGNGVGRVVNILAFLRRLYQWRRWLSFKPDVVIASSTYPADIYPALAIAKQHRSKLIWEVHDLWPLSPMELGNMSKWHPFIVWMQIAENKACKVANLVVSLLPKADSHLVQHGMSASKFLYVPNGVDPHEWVSVESSLPDQHAQVIARAKSRGHMLVGYTGAHGVANALDTILDAAKLTGDLPVTWVLVGNGPEKVRLQQRLLDESIQGVEILDAVPKAMIPGLLSGLDVLYIGSQNEPLYRFGVCPNKLMDYMMAGKPVICAIEAGNDPVGDAQCGLTIKPQDPHALRDAVTQMLALSPDERLTMGHRGMVQIQSMQTYPVLAQQFIHAVKQL